MHMSTDALSGPGKSLCIYKIYEEVTQNFIYAFLNFVLFSTLRDF